MNFQALFLAICIVESGGNPMAIGDGGKAHGVVQIRQECLDDYNRIYRTNRTYVALSDCHNVFISESIFVAYLRRYCTAKRIGRRPTLQDAARIWNGGPNGWKKTCTLDYWRRVKLAMKKG